MTIPIKFTYILRIPLNVILIPNMIIFLPIYVMHAVSSHLRLPRIVSGPDKLVIDKSKGDVTLNWKFKLRPTETWSNTIVEVVFGVWKHPGFLEKKLVAINNSGAKVVRTNYEKKMPLQHVSPASGIHSTRFEQGRCKRIRLSS